MKRVWDELIYKRKGSNISYKTETAAYLDLADEIIVDNILKNATKYDDPQKAYREKRAKYRNRLSLFLRKLDYWNCAYKDEG